jgi:hypothetical protein
MMAGTMLLATLILLFIIFLIYLVIKPDKLPKKRVRIYLLTGIIAIVLLFLYTGMGKIRSDISRIIHNSSPKSSYEVYSLLFKKPLDSCMTVINFKDQEIPKIDCCIWMEVRSCPAELARMINLKKYQLAVYSRADSLKFLNDFSDRPRWWNPQVIGDSLTMLQIKFDADNKQTLFFGKDSTQVFICDQAL